MDPKQPAESLYRFLLRLYPHEFQRRFSESMAEVFASDLARVRRLGRAAAARFWMRTIRDLLRLAFVEHLESWRNWRMNSMWQALLPDLRQAGRLLIKKPALSLTCIAALALGIGLAAAAFSIVYGTLLRGLPFEESRNLVHFERQNLSRDQSMAVSFHDYLQWRTQQTSFEDLAAFVEALLLLPSDGAPPERLWGVFIEPQAFSLLRIQPKLGRLFTSQEAEQGAPLVLLSHALWQRRYGADPAIVGRTIVANDEPLTVVGVMPEKFGFPIAEQFWLPMRLDLSRVERGGGRLDVFGRLKPGISIEIARAEFAAISKRLQDAYPESNQGVEATLRSFQEEYVGPEFSALVYKILLGAVLVLIIACANVANLMLAHTTARRQEFALRAALGAGRGRIASQLLAEALLLASLGAGLGLAIAQAGIGWFNEAALQSRVLRLPHGNDTLFWWSIELDAVPVLFVVGLAVGSCLLAGLIPGWLAAGFDLNPVSSETGRASAGPAMSRLSGGLVVLEVALTTGLLIVSGLTVKGVWNLSQAGTGISADPVLTARVYLPVEAAGQSEQRYPDHPSRLAFWQRLLEEVRSRPGVAQAAATNALPLQRPRRVPLLKPGRPSRSEDEQPRIYLATVSPGYFEAFQVGLLKGRDFTSADSWGSQPVAVVNRSFAERYFAQQEALGGQIQLGESDSMEPPLRIVGVVPDLWTHEDRLQSHETVYVPLAQSGTPQPEVRLGRWGLRFFTLAVRAQASPEGLPSTVREALYAVDPSVPAGLLSMNQVIERRYGHYQVYGRFYLIFGALALLLALLGLYGVLSYSVNRQRTEIGIKMALGATSKRILRSVLGRGLSRILAGMLCGAGIALWISHGLEGIFFRVELADPLVWSGTLSLILLAGLSACWIPARRAAEVDPIRAIRHH